MYKIGLESILKNYWSLVWELQVAEALANHRYSLCFTFTRTLFLIFCTWLCNHCLHLFYCQRWRDIDIALTCMQNKQFFCMVWLFNVLTCSSLSNVCDSNVDFINLYKLNKSFVSNKNQWFAWWIPFVCVLKLLGKFCFLKS